MDIKYHCESNHVLRTPRMIYNNIDYKVQSRTKELVGSDAKNCLFFLLYDSPRPGVGKGESSGNFDAVGTIEPADKVDAVRICSAFE